jgi:hypothetical protein
MAGYWDRKTSGGERYHGDPNACGVCDAAVLAPCPNDSSVMPEFKEKGSDRSLGLQPKRLSGRAFPDGSMAPHSEAF